MEAQTEFLRTNFCGKTLSNQSVVVKLTVFFILKDNKNESAKGFGSFINCEILRN